MKSFLNKELDKINLNESGILSLRFINEEQDISFDIDWCGQVEFADDYDFNLIKTRLVFEFVTDLEINIKYLNGSMGGLEISEFNYSQDKATWEIEFKFTFHPKGYIRFRCNDFKFIIEPSSPSFQDK